MVQGPHPRCVFKVKEGEVHLPTDGRYDGMLRWVGANVPEGHCSLAPDTSTGRPLTLAKFLKTASILFTLNMEAQAPQSPRKSKPAEGEGDVWVWYQIETSGPGGCLKRLMYEPEGDDFESDDDDEEGDGAETGGYHKYFRHLLSLLEAYQDDWEEGLKKIDAELSNEEEKASILRSMLFDSWMVYKWIVFVFVKFRKTPSCIFDRLATSRRAVEFMSGYAERVLERKDGRFYAQPQLLLNSIQELMRRYWYKEIHEMQQVGAMSFSVDWMLREELQSSVVPIRRAERNSISAYLEQAVHILTEAHYTVTEWSQTKESEEYLSAIKERCEHVIAVLTEPTSQRGYIRVGTRQEIVSLFLEITQSVTQLIQFLAEHVVHIPHAIEEVMVQYNSTKVLSIIDICCDCVLWSEQLQIVVSEVIGFVLRDSRKLYLTPDEDAPLHNFFSNAPRSAADVVMSDVVDNGVKEHTRTEVNRRHSIL